MNRYKAVRAAATDKMIERLLAFEDLPGDKFIEFLIDTEKWAPSEARSEWARLIRARNKKRSGQFRIH